MAIQAGAPPELVPEVSAYMVARGKISVESARDYLSAHSILTEGTQHHFERKRVPPSTLIVELDLDVPISINIVFESLTSEEKHLIIKEGRKPDPIQADIFGEGLIDPYFPLSHMLIDLCPLQVAWLTGSSRSLPSSVCCVRTRRPSGATYSSRTSSSSRPCS